MRKLDDTGRAIDGKPIFGGDIFEANFGYITTPYPKQKKEKYASLWLVENAAALAAYQGNNFAADQFKNTTFLKDGELTTSDRDSMLFYLFGN